MSLQIKQELPLISPKEGLGAVFPFRGPSLARPALILGASHGKTAPKPSVSGNCCKLNCRDATECSVWQIRSDVSAVAEGVRDGYYLACVNTVIG